MIPVAEYSSADEMMAAYRIRQARAPHQPKTVNVHVDAIRAENEALKTELAEARSTIDRQKHEISEYQGAALEYLREMEKLRGELFGDPDIHRRTVKEIVEEVLLDFPEFTLRDIKSARRGVALCTARHAAIYAVFKERDDLSYPRIGQFFGGRDHTSIIHSAQKSAGNNWKSRKSAA